MSPGASGIFKSLQLKEQAMSVSGINNNYLLYTQYLSTLNQSGNGGAGSSGQVSGSQSNSGGVIR